MSELVIYSGRNRPDLGPIYELYRQLTGTTVRVEKVYHHDVGRRVTAERGEPGADLLLTNSQLAMEAIRDEGVFEPYAAPVAERSAPRMEDLTQPRFRDSLACASLVEMTTVAQFAALRVARGDAYVVGLIDGLCANGMRIYTSNKDTREALAREGLAMALANSSNVHVFYLEGNAVGEAWLDQEGMGTHVEAHTVAILRGTPRTDEARRFIDFLLSAATQSFLARLYGETPVNEEAEHGWIKPLSAIHRMEAPIGKQLELMSSTIELLRQRGFETEEEG